MDRFAVLSALEKIPYFEMTASKLGILPELVEKDFWVCWTLKSLFSMEDAGAHLTFKGGTSLSKCYNAIERFSEDIDIAIERQYLDHDKNIEPSVEASHKENQRRIEALLASARRAIRNKILPPLRNKISDVLGENAPWKIELDPEDPLQQTLLFAFPAAIAKGDKSYVTPAVKIELGSRADNWPSQFVRIVPYVAEVLRPALVVDLAGVKVLSAERTFWEKAMILHRLCHSPGDKTVPKRMFRHYYDLYAMGRTGFFETALGRVDLLESVVVFNRLFYRYSWLNYDDAKRGSFRLVPHDPERIKTLKADYRQMAPMFFKEPAAFDEIMSGLREMEARINNG